MGKTKQKQPTTNKLLVQQRKVLPCVQFGGMRCALPPRTPPTFFILGTSRAHHPPQQQRQKFATAAAATTTATTAAATTNNQQTSSGKDLPCFSILLVFWRQAMAKAKSTAKGKAADGDKDDGEPATNPGLDSMD